MNDTRNIPKQGKNKIDPEMFGNTYHKTRSQWRNEKTSYNYENIHISSYILPWLILLFIYTHNLNFPLKIVK